MRKEKEAEALKKRFHLSRAAIAEALASDFVCSFFVNVRTHHYIEYSSSDLYRSLNLPAAGNDFDLFLESALVPILYDEDRDLVATALNKENVLRVLEVDRAFTLVFRVYIKNEPTYVELKMTYMIDDPEHIVCGLRNVDAHMKRIAEYELFKKNHLTFAGIAEALASDYVCLVYVDTSNDHYQEYSATPRFKRLGIPEQGDKFFFGPDGLGRFVYEEDLPLFNKACTKENILNVLTVDRSFALNVRLMVEGEPIYCRIKATKMMLESAYHIVVGIANVDEQVKREQGYAEAVNVVREIAYRDSLTGVKSKHAFTEAVDNIDKQIKEGFCPPFAIAVCDVNGLKKINDFQGHAAGDQFIKDSCMLVCKAFKHSPVYRIGGDEFVVLIEGEDYENRAQILAELNAIVEENHPLGKASVSVGISDFCKENDANLNQVLQRADELMYVRKKELKAERID